LALSAVFDGDRQALEAERGAAPPALAPELTPLLAPGQVVVQFLPGKPDGRVVPRLLLRAPCKVHGTAVLSGFRLTGDRSGPHDRVHLRGAEVAPREEAF